MKEFYTNRRMNTFSQFLAGIKYSLLRVFGDTDMLTMVPDCLDGSTVLEILKKEGSFSYGKDSVVLDFEYGVHIYTAYTL